MYATFTLFGGFFQNPSTNLWSFRLVRVRSPLLAESLIGFFSYRYLDVSVPCVRLSIVFNYTGYPIRTSADITLICSSPQLFAAYHVLRSLRESRHPPYALIASSLSLLHINNWWFMNDIWWITHQAYLISHIIHSSMSFSLSFLPCLIGKLLLNMPSIVSFHSPINQCSLTLLWSCIQLCYSIPNVSRTIV